MDTALRIYTKVIPYPVSPTSLIPCRSLQHLRANKIIILSLDSGRSSSRTFLDSHIGSLIVDYYNHSCGEVAHTREYHPTGLFVVFNSSRIGDSTEVMADSQRETQILGSEYVIGDGGATGCIGCPSYP
ncbi:hypothetical protein Tco_0439771 [Tanacetum coccineum]